RADVVRDMLGQIGEKHGVDPLLGLAVANAESAFNPNAVSSDGHFSKGLFQLLDSTAKHIMEKEGMEEEYTPFDPEQNADIGVRYLRYLHDLFNEETELPNNMITYPAANSSSLEKLAVAAFNAGEGRVASAQDRAARAGLDPREFENIEGYLPKTTQEYVQRVMAFKLDEEGATIGQFGDEL
ncbi:MAG: lytic transglycosylase domain-containing protein, partial [Bdellovibrionales bacterium]|nr:lytic transglycosylase domain-containing protein [Bdellovibrionales bacterium]